MEQLSLYNEARSESRVIASSGVFQIELLEHVGEKDHPALIAISEQLAIEYGEKAILTKATIHRYFNKKGSLPFIARYRKDIIGYIIGVPIEELSHEPWARTDPNFGKYNTLYTYAFVMMSDFKGNGYAKMLKRVFISWGKKREGIHFITGHVEVGVSSKFSGEVKIASRVENWQGTGKSFEYYCRDLHPDQSPYQSNNPPLATRI
ncbi:MAG: GNAT family N-acetyltransferase [Candidatus Marinimicrobia bacterium]|nr:GNAT family N-acetyltransferase [Candidatus Neomarinimicrobiota bacterium]